MKAEYKFRSGQVFVEVTNDSDATVLYSLKRGDLFWDFRLKYVISKKCSDYHAFHTFAANFVESSGFYRSHMFASLYGGPSYIKGGPFPHIHHDLSVVIEKNQ